MREGGDRGEKGVWRERDKRERGGARGGARYKGEME